MSVASLSGAQAHHHAPSQQHASGSNHKALDHAQIGEEVNLRILDKMAERRFLAVSGDSRYVVDSSLQFVVGQTVKATVSALGGVVELKYVGGGQFESVDAGASIAALDEKANAPLLDKLQSKYKRILSDADRELLARASVRSVDPESMAVGALYLSKIGAPIEDSSLHALHAQQVWQGMETQNPALAADVSALIVDAQQGQDESVAALAKLLSDAVDRSGTSTAQSQDASTQTLSPGIQSTQLENSKSNSNGAADGAALKDLARRLLNAQDAGTVACHYGSLPVLVANQLVELDLLLFRERESPTRTQGLRRLVMTLRTETLGRVEIVAQSLDNALSVSIATQSPEATERLAAQAQEVRDLVTRLGWNVDSVAYRLTDKSARAAEQLIRHVLSSGTLDALV